MADIQLNAARVREVAEMIEGERRRRDAVGVRARRRQRGAGDLAGGAGAARRCRGKEAIVRRRSEELEGFAGRVAHDLLNPISAAEMSLAATERGAAGNERMTTLAARGRRSLSRARGAGRRSVRVRAGGRAPAAGRDHVGGRGGRRRHRGAARARARARHHHRRRAGDRAAWRCAARAACWRACSRIWCATRSSTWAAARAGRSTSGSSPRHDRVRFEVEDTGPGLPPELVAHVFDPYVRGRRDRPSPGWAWGWRPCAAWSRATTAATASRRGRARARCSGSSCRRRSTRRAARDAVGRSRAGRAAPAAPNWRARRTAAHRACGAERLLAQEERVGELLLRRS